MMKTKHLAILAAASILSLGIVAGCSNPQTDTTNSEVETNPQANAANSEVETNPQADATKL